MRSLCSGHPTVRAFRFVSVEPDARVSERGETGRVLSRRRCSNRATERNGTERNGWMDGWLDGCVVQIRAPPPPLFYPPLLDRDFLSEDGENRAMNAPDD